MTRARALGWLRYAVTLPVDVIAFAIVLFVRIAWGMNLRAMRGAVFVDLRPDSWPMRSWYREWGGTTFGHAVMLAPLPIDRRVVVIEHELVHVEQIEVYALFALVYSIPIAIFWHPLAGLLTWSMASWLSAACASAIAWLRGRAAYDNQNEESARAQTGER